MTHRRHEFRTLLVAGVLAATISATLAHSQERKPARHDGHELAAPTATSSVFNCADSGSGSLRAAVAGAVSGASIDLTHLSCSTISLITGAISVDVDSLSITGPGASMLTIKNASDPTMFPDGRVLSHYSTGTLQLSNITMGNGAAIESGGCVLSDGNVTLQSSVLYNCTANAGDNSVGGGCVSAMGNVILRSTQLLGCEAVSRGTARGGGVYAFGDFYARDSAMANNVALSNGQRAFGGGLFVRGAADIERSAIILNESGQSDAAPGNVGGVFFSGSARLVNSLVAGNQAHGVIGGIYAKGPMLTIHNSTIVLNTAATSSVTGGVDAAAGVYLHSTPLDLKSTIIANNTFGAGNLFDLSGNLATVTGSHNLVMGTDIAPPDTLIDDPHLAPAVFVGGNAYVPLLPDSPAIDHGSNPDALATDQRGPGYARVFGAAADIGSFEVQPDDVDTIFANGFDGG